ncbi:hypothetical protein M9H77_36172 [Catharanthus roseus]|uniref:Uncharacterized protein n=1 Tax=Catharanthus roseus TaxID=4058 RepID=A0ACB9ZR21_CATRO|nr:hypothetical protein M9H77_36172 [Catharanthus roseus]
MAESSHAINSAGLGWRMLANPNALWTQALTCKYGGRNGLIGTTKRSNCSTLIDNVKWDLIPNNPFWARLLWANSHQNPLRNLLARAKIIQMVPNGRKCGDLSVQ